MNETVQSEITVVKQKVNDSTERWERATTSGDANSLHIAMYPRGYDADATYLACDLLHVTTEHLKYRERWGLRLPSKFLHDLDRRWLAEGQ